MVEEMDTCVESVEIGTLVEVEKDVVTDDIESIHLNDIKEPGIGMIFGSFEEAKRFYDDYARRKGFAIRTRSTYRDRRGPDLSSALLVCTCEGISQKTPKSDDEGKIRRGTSILRTGCKAYMRVTNIRGTTAWKITVFSDQHNHNLFTQSKGSNIVKYNRRKPRAVKNPTEAVRISNVYRQSARLAHMAGRSEEIYEIIMAVMEETFKKVSQMEEELFKNENDEKSFDKALENPNNLGSYTKTVSCTNQAIEEPLISQTNAKKRTREGKEKVNNTDILKSDVEMSVVEASKPRQISMCEGQDHESISFQYQRRKSRDIEQDIFPLS